MATKLNKTEEFYIENNTDLSAEELAAAMRTHVTAEDVQKYRDTLPEQEATMPTAGDAMARDTKKGVAIMTQTAAELSDAAEKGNEELFEELNKNRIHRIK